MWVTTTIRSKYSPTHGRGGDALKNTQIVGRGWDGEGFGVVGVWLYFELLLRSEILLMYLIISSYTMMSSSSWLVSNAVSQ